jgi:ABC-type branched-subunit amino acid transport system permease subunit
VGFRLTQRQLLAAGLALAFVVLPSLLVRNAHWLLTDYRAGVITVGVAFVAMALSLNILVGYAGQISVGHGALIGIGAFTTGLITGRWYLPAGLGLVLAAVIAGAFAFLVGIPSLRVRGLYLAITTIAFQAVTENFLLKMPWIARGSAGLEVPRPYAWGWNWTRTADFLGLALLMAAPSSPSGRTSRWPSRSASTSPVTSCSPSRCRARWPARRGSSTPIASASSTPTRSRSRSSA